MTPEDLKRSWDSAPDPGVHPSEEAILAFLDSGRDRAAVEAHLARCSACAGSLAGLLDLCRAPSSPDRRWIPFAAAAGLLAAAALWRQTPPPAPEEGSAPAPPAAFRPGPIPSPGGLWASGEEDAEAVLGDSVHALLRRGGVLRREAGAPLRAALERGAVLLDSPGENVALSIDGLAATFSDAALLAERLDASGLSLLLREARAGSSPCVRVKALRGNVQLGFPGGTRVLKEGEQALFPDGALAPAGIAPWAPDRGWIPLAGGLRIRDDRRSLLDPAPAGGYVFEALLRKRQAAAEVGLAFHAGGRGWEIPVGDNLLAAGEPWKRLRIEASPAGCRILLGSREILRRGAGELAREAWPREEGGIGLKAWGGDLEVREARWHP